MLRLSTTTPSPLDSPSPLSPSPSRLRLRLRQRCGRRLLVRALAVGALVSGPTHPPPEIRFRSRSLFPSPDHPFTGSRRGSPLTRDFGLVVGCRHICGGLEDVSYEQSRRLLQETEAAVRLIDSAGGGMDSRGWIPSRAVIKGQEALAVVSLMLFVESLQVTIKAAMKKDEVSHERLITLTETILDAVITKSLVKSIQDLIDDDGSVKDTASPELREYREQVQVLESRLYQLMDKLTQNAENEASLSEVCIVNGRCCVTVTGDKSSPFDGSLLSSGSDAGSLVEPIVAVPLNDELQVVRALVALVAKAELDALWKLTDKVAARAKYSIAYDGTCPDLYLPNLVNGTVSNATDGSISTTSSAHLSKKPWKLYMPNAYHPLLLQQHQKNLHRAKKDVASATAASF